MPWYVVPLNPEPWAVGPVGYNRRGGKVGAYVGQNAQLKAFQEAVEESLREDYILPPLIEGPVDLRMYFWRQRSEYKTPNQIKHRKHEADATNMFKATEDALQGVLFANDRDVRHTEAWIMEQGPDVDPKIIIFCDAYEPADLSKIPGWVWSQLDKQPTLDEGAFPLLDTSDLQLPKDMPF